MSSETERSVAPPADRFSSPAVTYHDGSNTYRATIDPPALHADEAVILCVATATDTDPEDVSPLFRVVDPDALDLLFDTSGGKRPFAGSLAFEYEGCTVTIEDGGAVVVEPPEDVTAE